MNTLPKKMRWTRMLAVATLMSLCSLVEKAAGIEPGYDCDLSVALISDISISMDDAGRLGEVKTAFRRLANSVPENRWKVGLGAFPPTTPSPTWPPQVVNNSNKASLLSAIDSLSVYNGSPMDGGLTLGASMVLADPDRKPFLVIASDGEILNREAVRSTADFLKNDLGIVILATGYNLGGADLSLMRDDVASEVNGERLYLDTAGGSSLSSLLYQQVSTLCFLREASLSLTESSFELARGGTATTGFKAKWNFGDPFQAGIRHWDESVVHVAADPPWNMPLSSANPQFAGKLAVSVSPSAPFGTSISLVTLARVTAPSGVADSKSVQVKVLDFNMTANRTPIQIRNPWVRGATKVETHSEKSINLTISYIVTTAGGSIGLRGFDSSLSRVSATAPTGDSVFTVPFQIKRSGAAPGTYDLHVLIQGAGLIKEVVFPAVVFP